MDFDEEFDDEFDDEFDEELDENLDEDLSEDSKDLQEPTDSITPDEQPKSKAPSPTPEGKKIAVFFMSTIGPGEKKQKLLVNTGNTAGAIKETAANLFGLDPIDFHLSTGGVTMDEASTLSDYDIRDGDDILLIPASTAGLYFV
ncbi:MAG: ubiquitin family protein [Candidatus Lokiarchaeota archaeon]|nr:ubiquitin family protein [Candidatus Lokiarchaeota archaeon]